MTDKQILKKLDDYMNENGISRYRLSQDTGIHQTQIKRYFEGTNQVPGDNLIRIAEALNHKLILKKLKN